MGSGFLIKRSKKNTKKSSNFLKAFYSRISLKFPARTNSRPDLGPDQDVLFNTDSGFPKCRIWMSISIQPKTTSRAKKSFKIGSHRIFLRYLDTKMMRRQENLNYIDFYRQLFFIIFFRVRSCSWVSFRMYPDPVNQSPDP